MYIRRSAVHVRSQYVVGTWTVVGIVRARTEGTVVGTVGTYMHQ